MMRGIVWALDAAAGAALTAAVHAGLAASSLGLDAGIFAAWFAVLLLLCRTRAGCACLFLLGALLLAGAAFLQFPVPLWSLLLFLPCAAALFFYRVYAVSLARSPVARPRTGAWMRQTALFCLAGLLIAGGLYAGVVRPLSPPTRELKLITRLQSMQALQVLGVSTTKVVTDPELISNAEPDRLDFSGQAGETPDDSLGGEAPDEPDESAGGEDSAVSSAERESYSAVRYWTRGGGWIWLAAAAAVLIAAAFALRVALKRRWRARVRALSHEAAAVNYYRYFAARLRRMGLKRARQQTLREYAGSHALQLEPFGLGEDSFATLTLLYERVRYGGGALSDAEYRKFEEFYDRFPRALRRELGRVKYALQLFRF